jgi:hypothetical protein
VTTNVGKDAIQSVYFNHVDSRNLHGVENLALEAVGRLARKAEERRERRTRGRERERKERKKGRARVRGSLYSFSFSLLATYCSRR